MTTYARLSGDRAEVLCGRVYPTGHYCDTILFTLTPGDERHLVGESDWRRLPEEFSDVSRRTDASPRYERTGWERKKRGWAPTRTGWTKVLAPKPGKGMKAIGLDRPAKCPQCNILNVLDPARLDVEPWPKGGRLTGP